MAGIVGYGAHIPRNRIKSEEIARQWGKDPAAIQRGLLLREKSVPGFDEDTITISVEAGRDAIERAGTLDPQDIRDALAATDLDTVAGHITFREDGTSPIDNPLMQRQDGAVKLIWPVTENSAEMIYPANE